MKFIHLSDLHIGKRINDYSMIDDQAFILKQIVQKIKESKAQAVVIAGDIYDKSVAAAEAVKLFDDFLSDLYALNIQVLISSGNHDSPERLAFGERLFSKNNIHLSPVYNGTIKKVTITDEYGNVNFYLLPFIKPAHVRAVFPDEKIESYTDAVKTAVSKIKLNKNERNVIISHQFVTGAQRSDSEELSLGGMDNVDAEVYFDFDYTALGHIHSPQKLLRETIRYSGTPLKYSFSECSNKNSITIVELKEKGNVIVTQDHLNPLHEMRNVSGTYDFLMTRKNYENTKTDDYLHITLTDQEEIPQALQNLRLIYPNIMKLDYDNIRTRFSSQIDGTETSRKTPLELIQEFYELQNNQPMNEEQLSITKKIIEKIEEDQK